MSLKWLKGRCGNRGIIMHHAEGEVAEHLSPKEEKKLKNSSQKSPPATSVKSKRKTGIDFGRKLTAD